VLCPLASASAQDEVACIGCKQCVWIAQGTFRIEPDHGRSRVFAQWVDTEDDIQVCKGCSASSTAGRSYIPFTLCVHAASYPHPSVQPYSARVYMQWDVVPVSHLSGAVVTCACCNVPHEPTHFVIKTTELPVRQAAIGSCPVSCIYWVEKDQLPPLEYVMQRHLTERPNVGVMMSGAGDAVPDVFNATARYVQKREEKCVPTHALHS